MEQEQHQHDQQQQQLRRRPRPGEPPIKYGDVFDISDGDQLAGKPISPRDASAMQSAENKAFGKTVKGGPAALMQSAATKNVQAGLVGQDDSSDAVPGEQQRAAVPHVHVPMSSTPDDQELIEKSDEDGGGRGRGGDRGGASRSGGVVLGGDAITIGDALEAAAGSVGDKPVDRSDAAAISAAEMSAAGMNAIPPSRSLGAAAEAAAVVNERMVEDRNKTTIGEIIGDAKSKLAGDKPVDRRDAELVMAAEMRGDAEGLITSDPLKDSSGAQRSMTPGGVAHAVSSAARINQA